MSASHVGNIQNRKCLSTATYMCIYIYIEREREREREIERKRERLARLLACAEVSLEYPFIPLDAP